MYRVVKEWWTKDGYVTISRPAFRTYMVRWPVGYEPNCNYEKLFNWPNSWNEAQKFAAEKAREIEARS